MPVTSTAGFYKVHCHNCETVYIYIGGTGNDVNTRNKKHKYAKRIGDCNNAIFKHVSEKNHRIGWKGSHIIHKYNDYEKRRIIESLCILKCNNINLSDGAFQLDPMIRQLVEKFLPAFLSLSDNDGGRGVGTSLVLLN